MRQSALASGAPQSPVDIRILDMAALHIRQFGLGKTTIVSIAETAGMSHANVYRYFSSKEAVLDAVTEQWLKPVEAGLREITDSADPAYDKIERVISMIYRAYRSKLEDDANIFTLLANAAREEREVAIRHRKRVFSDLAHVVEEGMASGVFFNGDVQRAVSLVTDAAHRFIHPASIILDRSVGRSQLDARFERVSRLIGRALISGAR